MRVYCLKTLNKLSIYPLDKTPSAPSGTYTVFLLVVHKWSNGPTSVGAVTGLTTDTNSGTTNTEVVDSARDSTRRRRHCMVVMQEGITKAVDGERPANGVPYIPSQLGQLPDLSARTILLSSGSSPTPITATHHFSFRSTNGITSALHPLSS